MFWVKIPKYMKDGNLRLKPLSESAAKEIRKVAIFLRLESGWATKEDKDSLIASARELDKLADKIERDRSFWMALKNHVLNELIL